MTAGTARPMRRCTLLWLILSPWHRNGSRDPMIPIAALVLLKERTDRFLQARIFVPGPQYLLLAIESAARQAGHFRDSCKG
jgi:hypothetical protein